MWEGNPLQTVSLGMPAGDSGRLGVLVRDDTPDIYSVRHGSEDPMDVPVVRETRKAMAWTGRPPTNQNLDDPGHLFGITLPLLQMTLELTYVLNNASSKFTVSLGV